MYPVNTNTSLNAIYNSMAAQITAMPSKILFGGADIYTGKSDAETSVRLALANNAEKKETINSGIADVQTNRDDLSAIEEKVNRIKVLADNAASGTYSGSEVADMQTEVEAIIVEIDDLAHGEPGEKHMLINDAPTQSYDMGNGVSIDIDTTDFTSAGLGLDAIDLTTDASAAQIAADTALSDTESYDDYLVIKGETFEATSAALEIQETALQAAESILESVDSAMSMVAIITSQMASDAGSFYATQANALAEMAVNLLTEQA
jgi:flagellin